MAKRIKVIRLVPYAGASALKRLKHFVELMLQDRRLHQALSIHAIMQT